MKKNRVLLIDDQAIVAEAVKKMVESQSDIAFHYCQDPLEALAMAKEIEPTVILQDLIMPQLDGLDLLRRFRNEKSTSEVPMIVLSGKEEPQIKAEAFALGANDYIVKLPDEVELLARIRYHSAAYIRLQERNEAYSQLKESQMRINADLTDAAAYVKALLPPPMQDQVKTAWRYIPSSKVGGDAFGYHWIDSEHFAFYLLDVCGHGVGAALLSISAMNVLRSSSLLAADFCNPSQVLEALNRTFQMESHHNMFFTLWYGVYNVSKREITYSSAGHPPAVLFENVKKPILLKENALAIGAMPNTKFQNATLTLKESVNRLYLFSDGVFELIRGDGSVLTFQEFLEVLTQVSHKENDLELLLQFAASILKERPYHDDYSIVKFEF